MEPDIFRRRRIVFILLLGVFCCSAFPVAWAREKKALRVGEHRGQPVVQEVSPPNWWSGLPNPMLLLQGKNLTDADVATSVAGISVRRTKVSANGHWAFVWLDISGAQPQHFSLLVRTASGKARFPYELDKRHAAVPAGPIGSAAMRPIGRRTTNSSARTEGFQGFSSSDVMYLAMPDRFSDGDVSTDHPKGMPDALDRSSPSAYHGGDLAGIENHLDYLQKLGVTTLWITPLYAQDPASASDYSGYRPVDFYRMNPHFGTLADYEGLAEALHARGMKLVLDMVMNHVGPANPWVLDPPAPDWFHGTPQNHMEATKNFAVIADPHASPETDRAPVHGWLPGPLPDLNQSNPLVKQYLIQNAVWWIETGTLDGLRLDTFANVDRSFWRDFHTMVHALYPHLTAVGEVFSPDPTVVSYFAGGVKQAGIDTGLDTLFDYPGYFALRAGLTGTTPAPMTSLTDIERQDWLYPHPERLVTFIGNQDTPRFLSQPGATAEGLKIVFGLLATLRGMPQIYYGDEIGISAGKDGDSRRDFPGGFSGNTNDAFTAAGRTAAQQAMYDWVSGLLRVRAENEALQTGLQQNLLVDGTGLVFARYAAPASGDPAPGNVMLVLTNKSAATRTFHLNFSHTALDGVDGLSPAWNAEQPVTVTNDMCDVTVGPQTLEIFSTKPPVSVKP